MEPYDVTAELTKLTADIDAQLAGRSAHASR